MSEQCEPGTGWVYCAHAIEELTVCDCSCTDVDQRHCPRLRRYEERPELQGRNWHWLRIAAPIRRATEDTKPMVMRADLPAWRRLMAAIEW